MNIDLIKGICPIVAAPFANDESVDYDSLRNLVATLAKGGCHALTLFGIAGEYYKLDDAEQREMMRVTIDEAHRHNVPVIVSNTRHSTANAVSFAKEIQRAGADCMMILPPFFLQELMRSATSAVITKCSACIWWSSIFSTLTGRKVPSPTWSVTSAISTPFSFKA